MGKVYHYDKALGKVVEGYPVPQHDYFGDAPIFISDTIQPYRHPATGQWTDSRSTLRAIDKATGTITTDKKLAPDSSKARREEERRRQDWKRCMREAVRMVDDGTAPMSEETKALCRRQNEIISAATGMDAFNVAGRKRDARGKRYRK